MNIGSQTYHQVRCEWYNQLFRIWCSLKRELLDKKTPSKFEPNSHLWTTFIHKTLPANALCVLARVDIHNIHTLTTDLNQSFIGAQKSSYERLFKEWIIQDASDMWTMFRAPDSQTYFNKSSGTLISEQWSIHWIPRGFLESWNVKYKCQNVHDRITRSRSSNDDKRRRTSSVDEHTVIRDERKPGKAGVQTR